MKIKKNQGSDNYTPEVRFPEFKEEWKFMRGNELFERISNKNHNSDLPILAISQEFGAIPRHLINYKISVTEKSVSSYKVVEKGDFIISLRSFQGGIEYSNYKGICSPAYIILRPTIELEADFYKSHFKSYRYIQQLQSKLEGIRDGKMISYKYFSEIKLPFPTLPEQQKIAHFFSVIDKKISQLQEKKTALELYKKGMMQRLFVWNHDVTNQGTNKNQDNKENQEKSRFRQLRFKDDNGKDFPEWEVKKLREVCKVFSGGTPTSSNKSYYKGDIPFIGSGNISDNEVFQFITQEALNNSSSKMVEVGDLLYALYGGTSGEVSISKIKGAINQAVLCIKTTENKQFLYQFLKFDKERIITTFLQGGQGNLSAQIIKNLKIKFPTLKEQTKIANFLSKIADKIHTVTEQIEKTKAYKKGLLQKMFV